MPIVKISKLYTLYMPSSLHKKTLITNGIIPLEIYYKRKVCFLAQRDTYRI